MAEMKVAEKVDEKAVSWDVKRVEMKVAEKVD